MSGQDVAPFLFKVGCHRRAVCPLLNTPQLRPFLGNTQAVTGEKPIPLWLDVQHHRMPLSKTGQRIGFPLLQNEFASWTFERHPEILNVELSVLPKSTNL